MGWKIINGSLEIPLGNSRIIGAADIGSANALSKTHFQLTVENNRVYLRDLGSEHGTFIEGKKLLLHDRIELAPQEFFRASNLTFQLQYFSPPNFLLFGSPIALIAFLSIFFNSSLAFGDSISWLSVFKIALVVMISYGCAIGTWKWILFDKIKLKWAYPAMFLFAVMIASTGMLTNYAAIRLLNSQFAIGHQLAADEIDYFCFEHFDRPQCVKAILLCPSCAKEIPEGRRATLAWSLKAARYYYPASARQTH